MAETAAALLMLGCALVALVSAGVADMPNGISIDAPTGGDLIEGLMARDSEPLPGPLAYGHKFMTGGAGEGDQRLAEDGEFQHREQVKSDNVLPAYCEPPNPCPVGFTAENGCLEEFENSAEFSREYQAQQRCICDQEHMFNCAEKQATDSANNLQDMLDEDGKVHPGLIAKKFHEKRGGESYIPRRKRSINPNEHAPNPYLQGEPLRTVQKKDGRHF